jgi:hypothetical protein
MATASVSSFPSPHRITLNDRMERLRQDASGIAHEHATELLRSFEEAAALAEQVAGGGEAYHVGVREIARRALVDLNASALNLRSLLERAR